MPRIIAIIAVKIRANHKTPPEADIIREDIFRPNPLRLIHPMTSPAVAQAMATVMVLFEAATAPSLKRLQLIRDCHLTKEMINMHTME
jgi:hypothetical protein